MNVVVRETGPPCASKLPVKIKHIEILRPAMKSQGVNPE
jgi:hypothetical protein